SNRGKHCSVVTHVAYLTNCGSYHNDKDATESVSCWHESDTGASWRHPNFDRNRILVDHGVTVSNRLLEERDEKGGVTAQTDDPDPQHGNVARLRRFRGSGSPYSVDP